MIYFPVRTVTLTRSTPHILDLDQDDEKKEPGATAFCEQGRSGRATRGLVAGSALLSSSESMNVGRNSTHIDLFEPLAPSWHNAVARIGDRLGQRLAISAIEPDRVR